MDLLQIWEIAKICMGLGALAVLVLTLAAVLRFRGIWHWRRSLRDEIEAVARDLEETVADSRRAALTLVLQSCRRIKNASSADLQELSGLLEYMRSIAACYHSDAKRPELQIRLGKFFYVGRLLALRLDRVLNRPGFKFLQRAKIRQIRQALNWYNGLRRSKIVRWFQTVGRPFKRLYWLRLILMPDLFTWLAYFSNRLTLLVLAKCLLTDIYLFVGKICVEAFAETGEADDLSVDVELLEDTLVEIDRLEPENSVVEDPQIAMVRERLAGLNRLILSSPGLADFKEAVREAAQIIAASHFPAAERPLEEAAIGPLLRRSCSWLSTLCNTEKLPVVKNFFGIRLATLYDMKSISDGRIFEQVKALAKRGRRVYRLVKWPLRAFRWVKKTSPVKITLGVGWVIVKKSMIGLVFRYGFDTACRELEEVYRQSV